MLQNAYFLAKIGADTAENEQHCAEILPTFGEDVIRAEQGRLGRAPALQGEAGPADRFGKYAGSAPPFLSGVSRQSNRTRIPKFQISFFKKWRS